MQIKNTADVTGPTGLQKQSRWGGVRDVIRKLPICFVIVACIGLIVRIVLRDRVPVLATFYYGLPVVLQGALLAIAAAGWGIQKKWRRALPCAIGAAALLAWWHQASYFEGAADSPNARPRVLFWNIGRGKLGFDAIAAKLRERDADVIALAEAGKKDNSEFWAKQLPGYARSDWRGGLMIFVRGKLGDQEYVRLDSGRYMTAKVEAGGLSFRFAVGDVISNPLDWRKRPLDEIREIVDRWAGEPLVVVGDFNTPADSVFFDSWREKMDHAFEQSGDGYFATWPCPLPMIAIDQAWVSRSLRSRHCRLISTLRSDHRIVEFELAPAR